MLVNHTGEVDTKKDLKYSNCCDVSDSIHLSNSQTRSEEIPLESCKILEELDGIKIKNKNQNGFALCKGEKKS